MQPLTAGISLMEVAVIIMATLMTVGMAMSVIVMVAPVISLVGTTGGIEGHHGVLHSRSQSFQHRLDHMIAQHEYAVRFDCRRQVPVSDMPSQLDQMSGVFADNLIQRFVSCCDLDTRAVFQHQHISGAERYRAGEVDQHLPAVVEAYGAAAQVALVMCHHRLVTRQRGAGCIPDI
jgi:hypothetical protein